MIMRKKQNQEKGVLLKILKSRITILMVCFAMISILFTGCSNDDELNKLKAENETLTKEMQELKENEIKNEENKAKVEAKNEELNKKVSTAEEYLSLNSSEKELVDAKIEEVKKATEEEKARLKAEEEAKKAEEEAKLKAEQEAKEAEEKAKKEAEEQAKKEAEAQKYNTGLTYKDIARNPTENAMKLVTFSGRIVQVMKADGYTQYRMAIDDNYDQIVLIEVDNELLSNGNILEDDYITIKGTFVMEHTYQTVMGAQKTIPAIVVDEFNFN